LEPSERSEFALAAAAATPAFACPPRGCHGPSYYAPQPAYYPPQPAYYPQEPAYQPQPVYTPVSQPVSSVASAATARAAAAVQQARAVADQASAVARVRAQAAQAKAAFTARNYGTALELMNQVVKAAPQNSEALEFRSLIRFAMADYKPAASDAYESLKYGPVWNTAAVQGLYGNMMVYERHLKELEEEAAARPDAMELRFLLAQHMLMKGDLAKGEKELEAVLKIKPAEPMAARLLTAVRDARSKDVKQVASDTP
jgi:predicted Zn-dependent protease